MPSYSRKVQIPGKTAQELYDTVSTDIDRFIERAPAKFELERLPALRQVKLKSSMATATLVCQEGSIEVNASLSLLAAPFRSKIDDWVDRWLAKTFSLKV